MAWWLLLTALLCAYLPFYLTGAQYTGKWCIPSFTSYRVWRWVWHRFWGLPLSECRWNVDDFSDKSKRYIFGSHPHGVMSLHHIGPMLCPSVCEPGKSFSDLSPISIRRDLAASILFRIPFLRELALLAGAVDADRKVASRLLSEGYSLGIMVGGEQEQILARQGCQLAFVQQRKGHVKLALRFGVSLVPCYCFGETDLYYQSAFAMGLRRWVVKMFGIAITLPIGRNALLPFLPKPVKLFHCVGKPIPVPQVAEPTEAQVTHYHELYIAGLRAVFEENKDACGYPNAELMIV
ncbi:hypothetical protein AB1Y20_010159 [Prymnesium parvum]|uniref:diacylglycerol O-acyltransferase n=1 Tax=Prymnesium parvum TaxID=97485 RepID=A0AB34K756_PRYPA